MQVLQFYKEIEIESKSQDLLNQIRNNLLRQPGSQPTHQTITELPRRRVLAKMENKNWEIVEKPDSSTWIRFYDDLTYAEFMLLC